MLWNERLESMNKLYIRFWMHQCTFEKVHKTTVSMPNYTRSTYSIQDRYIIFNKASQRHLNFKSNHIKTLLIKSITNLLIFHRK